MASSQQGSSHKQSSEAKKKTPNRFQQVIQVYQIVRRGDKHLDWQTALAFFGPLVALIMLGIFMHWHWLTWIFWMISGIMTGLILAMLLLTRKADQLSYRQVEGKLGGGIATLQRLKKVGYTFPEEPVWMDPRRQEAIWCGTSYNGIYLIGEGNTHRLNEQMKKFENRLIKGVTSGSQIPVFYIHVGSEPGQVPVNKLYKHVMRCKDYVPTQHSWSVLKKVHPRRRFTFTQPELTELNDRLRTLQKRNALSMPHGIDPTRPQRISRRAMRGR